MTATVRPDLYPTRVIGESVPQLRTDPSVWGEAGKRLPVRSTGSS